VSPADLFPQVADALSLWAWTFGLPEPTRKWTAEISGFSQVPGWTSACACPGLIPRGTLDARPVSAPRMMPSVHPTTSAPQIC